MARIAVAMSGGVDSSVTAALLKEKGHDVIGVTMKIWDGDTVSQDITRHSCYGPGEDEDIQDACKVAEILRIPHYTLDLSQEYRAEVLDYCSREYISGRTPNPCVRCNRRVKFDALIRKAFSIGLEFDCIATGHYVRLEYNESSRRYLLKKAVDVSKDQSYFLFSLSQEQLSRSLFPLGSYTKKEVRKIAGEINLGITEKPESQDFIAGGYTSILGVVPGPGPILDKEGNILGQHRGITYYTIGQRKGLGISFEKPLYVTDIDRDGNAVVVGTKEEVYGDELIASELNWIAIDELKKPIEVKAKIRYRHKEAAATVIPIDEDKVRIKFHEPQMAITPGQAVVFYDEVLVGGGIIEREVKCRNA